MERRLEKNEICSNSYWRILLSKIFIFLWELNKFIWGGQHFDLMLKKKEMSLFCSQGLRLQQSGTLRTFPK